MIDAKKAREIAEKHKPFDNVELGKCFDWGDCFVFDYTEEIDVEPVAIDKKTGRSIYFFPPDHFDVTPVEVKA